MEMKPMSLFGITPYEAPKRRNIPTVQVTVCKHEIIIPNLAYEKFGKPQFVEVGFNEEKRFFGIKPCTVETKYAVEVIGDAKSSHRISRVAIVEKIRSLRPWDARRYNLILDKGEFDEQSGYWLFDLDACQEVSCKTRNRRK